MTDGTAHADVLALEARVAELERRMDSVMSRIGYLPGDVPLQREDAHWDVAPDVVEIARGGSDDDLARAILEHIKRTHAEPETAKQAVLRAVGRA